MNTRVYDINVLGVTCIGCASKILKNIPNNSELAIQVDVNVLSQKVQVSLKEGQSIDKVVEIIRQLNFKIPDDPYLIPLNDDKNKRVVYFDISLNPISKKDTDPPVQEQPQSHEMQQKQIDLEKQPAQNVTHSTAIAVIDSKLVATPGVIQVDTKCNRFTITYNPQIVKARKVFDLMQECSKELSFYIVEVYDPYIEALQKKDIEKQIFSVYDLSFSFFIFLVFLIFAIILPDLESATSMVIYPYTWNIFSIYLLIMIALTLFIVKIYGIKIFKSAYQDFFINGEISMEGLVTIGSLGALLMSTYLIIYYAISEGDGQTDYNSLKQQQGIDLASLTISKLNELDRRLKIKSILDYLSTTALILTFINIGKFLEGKAKGLINDMTDKIFPKDFLVSNKNLTYIELKNNKFKVKEEKTYEISLLEKGDIIKVQAPMRLLVDGVLVHKIKDESFKVIDSVCYGTDDAFTPNVGEKIKSGAQIVEGMAYLQLESSIENSMLSKLSTQLNIAQNQSQTSQTGLAGVFKKAADHFSKFVIVISLGTLFVWLLLVGLDKVDLSNEYCRWCIPFERAIAVLVASCPCGLGLAVPSVIVVSLNLGIKHQLLLKKNKIFDKISKVGAIAFDKTGTLFTRLDSVQKTYLLSNSYQEAQIWEMILVLERDQKHPLAEFLYKESLKRVQRNLTELVFSVQGQVSTQKQGVSASLLLQGRCTPLQVAIGNFQFVSESCNIDSLAQADEIQREGKGFTQLYIAIDKSLSYVIFLDNTNNLRPEAKSVVNYLQKELKKKVYILSGDSKESVQTVGEYLGIPLENQMGENDANDKQNILRKIREVEKSDVMMIGDGLNDILSISEAGIGVSINAKSELNLIASDVVALNENLWSIPTLFKILKYSRIFIIINLCWALSYNIFIIPVAAGVFSSYGLAVTPTIASAAMSISDVMIMVISNFMRVFDFDFSKREEQQQQQPIMQQNSKNVLPTIKTQAREREENIDIPEDRATVIDKIRNFSINDNKGVVEVQLQERREARVQEQG